MRSARRKCTTLSWSGSRNAHEEVRHRARSGHYVVSGHAHRSRRPGCGQRAAALSAAVPSAGLGGARSPRHPVVPAGRLDRALAHLQRESGRDRFDRHYQPARDHRGVGPRHRRAHRERHRVAVPPHGSHGGGPDGRPGGRGRDHGPHGPGSRRLLLGEQDRLDFGGGARGPGPRRGRRARLRHRRQLAHLEAHLRGRARHRCDQRESHHALQHPRRLLGPLSAGALRHPRLPHARGAPLGRRLRRDGEPGACARYSHPRGGRRSAGGPVRPVLLFRRSGEEHLRHRLLSAHAHGS